LAITFVAVACVFPLVLSGIGGLRESEASLTAAAAVAALRATGFPCDAQGARVTGSEAAALEVRENCSIFPFAALLAAFMIALPAKAVWKVLGVVSALLILWALNVGRVATLLLGLAFEPGWFPALHLEIWPMLWVLACALFAGGWMSLARSAR
jgi:exosortase/archaeosortase family protein